MGSKKLTGLLAGCAVDAITVRKQDEEIQEVAVGGEAEIAEHLEKTGKEALARGDSVI